MTDEKPTQSKAEQEIAEKREEVFEIIYQVLTGKNISEWTKQDKTYSTRVDSLSVVIHPPKESGKGVISVHYDDHQPIYFDGGHKVLDLYKRIAQEYVSPEQREEMLKLSTLEKIVEDELVHQRGKK